MSENDQIRKALDESHLKILFIVHYIFAAHSAIGGFFTLFQVRQMMKLKLDMESHFPPGLKLDSVNQHLIDFGIVTTLFAWIMSLLAILIAQGLLIRKYYKFCFFLSCVLCLAVPIGTILGIFTIIVLKRPSVKVLFLPRLAYEPERQGG